MNHNRKLWVALFFAALVLLIDHELKLYLPDLKIWIQKLGVYAPLGFVLLFVVLAPMFVSIDALCFAAGILFPIVTGELAVIIATYLSAALIFYLGQDLETVLKVVLGCQPLKHQPGHPNINECFGGFR
jgi:uncharacterized membrane protein YdjX (TVP38/TMEM64 family)